MKTAKQQIPYDNWVQMRTPSGFYGRKYIHASGSFCGGHWYFRLNFVKPAIRSNGGGNSPSVARA